MRDEIVGDQSLLQDKDSISMSGMNKWTRKLLKDLNGSLIMPS